MSDLMRSKFHNILKKYGHNVLLQRRVVRNGEGVHNIRPNHGYSNRLERHTVRSRMGGKYSSLPNVKDEFPEGLVFSVDKIYYFKHNVVPTRGDRIYETEDDGDGVFLIDWTHGFRGRNGKVVYWGVGASIIQKGDRK